MEQILSSIITVLGGTLITCIIAWKQHKLNNDNTEKELFKDYNQRYSELNEKLINIIRFNELNENQELYNAAIEFFNLCAEGYYWKKKGRISGEIWKSWNSNMNSWLRRAPVLCELWESEMIFSGPESYYIKDKYEFFDKSNFKKL